MKRLRVAQSDVRKLRVFTPSFFARAASLVGIGLISLQLAGCCNIPRPELFDGSMMDRAFGCYRNRVWAKRACVLRYSNCNRPYASHFESGFEAGYEAICNGGDGYVPATPPECYWGFDYQTPDGAQCVNAWFEGYPKGVAAAKRDRAGTYRDVYVSRMIQSALKQEKLPRTSPSEVPVVGKEAAQRAAAERASQEKPVQPPRSARRAIQNPTPADHPQTGNVNEIPIGSMVDSVVDLQHGGLPPIVSGDSE